MTEAEFVRAYRSAGLWFVGSYMELFLQRQNELRDSNKRSAFIKELYKNGNNGFDTTINGTNIRVSSLQKIIEGGKVVEALDVVIQSDRVAKEHPESILAAKELLKKIQNRTLAV